MSITGSVPLCVLDGIIYAALFHKLHSVSLALLEAFWLRRCVATQRGLIKQPKSSGVIRVCSGTGNFCGVLKAATEKVLYCMLGGGFKRLHPRTEQLDAGSAIHRTFERF